MKGHIIIPKFYATRWTDDYKYLLAMIAKEFKFHVEYSNNPKIESDTDVVIVFATPHHMRPDDLMHLADLDKHIKVIGYMKDIQHHDRPKVKANYCRMFDRYDVILSCYDEMFREWYPDYVEKMVHFCDFFGPYERYDMPFHEKPDMACLMAGSVDKETYPLRQHILETTPEGYVDYLPPPYTGHDYIGDKYAKLLNEYWACISTSGRYLAPVAKCFEIPAAGSLLLCNTFKDLLKIGFVPWKHYVPISFSMSAEMIQKVVKESYNYKEIRKLGTQFVRENHSIKNRFETLKTVIHDCLN